MYQYNLLYCYPSNTGFSIPSAFQQLEISFSLSSLLSPPSLLSFFFSSPSLLFSFLYRGGCPICVPSNILGMYFSDFLVNNHISVPSQTGSPTPLIQSRAPAILLSGLFLEYPPCCPTSEALFMLLLMFNLASPAHAHLLKFYPPSNSISDASFFMTQH